MTAALISDSLAATTTTVEEAPEDSANAEAPVAGPATADMVATKTAAADATKLRHSTFPPFRRPRAILESTDPLRFQRVGRSGEAP